MFRYRLFVQRHKSKIEIVTKKQITRNFHKIHRKMAQPFAVQKYDYFYVLDFEATCQRDSTMEPQEIIEFPCLRVKGSDFSIESQFHRYVRPIHHPNLTHFCTELTGITQDMVESEKDFKDVLNDFNYWMAEQRPGQFTFVTCGDWDLKTMLPNQCRTSDLPVPDSMTQWINIKKSYHAAKGNFPRSLQSMLQGVGLTFEGRQHSGIDDSFNILRIMRELAKQGHVFVNTTPSMMRPLLY